jgi:hypothetical protein
MKIGFALSIMSFTISILACGGSPQETSSSSNALSGTCKRPTDCTGLLPRDVQLCADNTSAGAQWDCVQRRCTISYCDDHGGTATAAWEAAAGSTCGADWGDLCCDDSKPCPTGQTCINKKTSMPAVNGQGGFCSANRYSCQQKPSDCTGVLPSDAQLCADGTSAGAQWDCIQNQCTVSYCDTNGGLADTGGFSFSVRCDDLNPCPPGQVCVNPQTTQPAVNGQGGFCQSSN